MYKTATDIVAWAEVDDATSEEVESVIAEVGRDKENLLYCFHKIMRQCKQIDCLAPISTVIYSKMVERGM